MADDHSEILQAVTQRVVDRFTRSACLFTALDVSNAVKGTLPTVRHREISPVVRELFQRGAMGEYLQTLIDVKAGGNTPTQAFLYHLPGDPTTLYDDAMRSQLAIPPVSASLSDDEPEIDEDDTECTVEVGKDGRGRIPRQIILNAGIPSSSVVAVQPGGARLELHAPGSPEAEGGEEIFYEHPTLLHLPKRQMQVFPSGAPVTARVEGDHVVLVPGEDDESFDEEDDD